MKKLIALLMTLVMLTGTCAAFAEAEAVDHQAALMSLLEEAGVELQPGDLSRSFQKALSATVMSLVLTHTKLTEEQLTEWEAAMAAAIEEIKALETEDAERTTQIFRAAIDGIESITPFTKSMLKRMTFNSMYLRSEVTHKERQAIRAIYDALEAELHGADAARTEEIVAGIRAGMEGLVELHNVRDDMMYILKFLQEANRTLLLQMDDEGWLRTAAELMTAADQVIENLSEKVDEALAEIQVADAELMQENVQKKAGVAFERMDEEELAEVAPLIEELANAVLQGDMEAVKEDVRHLNGEHVSVQLDQMRYETLLGMEDEELRVLAVDLLAEAHGWQSGDQDTRAEKLSTLELNWEALSEEDVAAIKDIVAKELEGSEIPEEAREAYFEKLLNKLVVLNGFSEEESMVRDTLERFLNWELENETLDAAQLAELENEMEILLYELAGDSDKYAVTPEDLAAVLETVELEKVEGLSDAAKFLLSIRFIEHFEVYNMLTEEKRAKLPEIDKALYEAIQGLEVNGQETTEEQMQALDVAVADVLSQLDIPAEVMAKEVSKTVSNCLYMSALSAEEQEVVEAALEAISQTLMEGNREEIRVLRNYHHKVLHHMEEGLVKPQLQNAQA